MDLFHQDLAIGYCPEFDFDRCKYQPFPFNPGNIEPTQSNVRYCSPVLAYLRSREWGRPQLWRTGQKPVVHVAIRAALSSVGRDEWWSPRGWLGGLSPITGACGESTTRNEGALD